MNPCAIPDVPGRCFRCYRLAEMTVRVRAELPIERHTFADKLRAFEVDAAGEDVIDIAHRFGLPACEPAGLGRKLYGRPPWAVYHGDERYYYLGIPPDGGTERLHKFAVFSDDHTRGRIHSPDARLFKKGGLQSLTTFPTDQVLLARVLADRRGAFLHSSAAVMNGRGFVFAGHSGAGKSTLGKMLHGRARILCDDRNIVRRRPEGYRVYGTWSHGELPVVSADSAPLAAIFFLHKGARNRIERIEDRREITAALLGVVIRPLATRRWWENTLDLVEDMARTLPAYRLSFDRSGRVAGLLEKFAPGKAPAP